MSNDRVINIAAEFSKTPAGRYLTDGPFSGELFREQVLLPALQSNLPVTVNLDGTLGYGSSFLEEAFGGLIRKGLRHSDLKSQLRILSSRKFYEGRIWKYISDAENVRRD